MSDILIGFGIALLTFPAAYLAGVCQVIWHRRREVRSVFQRRTPGGPEPSVSSDTGAIAGTRMLEAARQPTRLSRLAAKRPKYDYEAECPACRLRYNMDLRHTFCPHRYKTDNSVPYERQLLAPFEAIHKHGYEAGMKLFDGTYEPVFIPIPRTPTHHEKEED